MGYKAAAQARIFTIAIPANMTKSLDFSTADMTVSKASDINLTDINDKLLIKWQICRYPIEIIVIIIHLIFIISIYFCWSLN